MNSSRPALICLTPVKNESWILERFLKFASLWADYIIISDQGSDDGSQEIARCFSKVILIDNKMDNYDEYKMRNVLYNEARRIKGDKIFFAIDTDEMFTPNFNETDDWGKILKARPGTVLKSGFVNLKPDLQNYWLGPFDLPWGFVDDGSPYLAEKIHTSRMIEPESAETLLIKDFSIIHFQYVDWERMNSKQRWYQCWERANNPNKSAVEIFRGYHHMYAIRKKDFFRIPDSWFSGYGDLGIDIKTVKKDKDCYWDKIVLEYFDKFGRDFFSRIFLWNINWIEKAKYYGYSNFSDYKDPRGIFTKFVHFWLIKTQLFYKSTIVRIVDKLIKKIFSW